MSSIKFKIRFILILVACVLAPILFAQLFNNVQTSFNVVAQTEYLEFSANQNVLSSYNLSNAKIYYGDSIPYKNFNGVIKLADSITVQFIRNTQNDLYISIISKASNKKIAQLFDEEETYLESFYDHVNINIEQTDSLVKSGISLLYPIRGSIELGRSVDFLSVGDIIPILRSGQIVMIVKSLFGRKHFIAGEDKLELGDVLRIKNNTGIGFVSITENSNYLATAFRAKGSEAHIIKPGPKLRNKKGDIGIVVSASLLDRFLNDSFFAAISSIIAILIFGISLTTFFFDFQEFKSKNY